jgi:hypothetical protein
MEEARNEGVQAVHSVAIAHAEAQERGVQVQCLDLPIMHVGLLL